MSPSSAPPGSGSSASLEVIERAAERVIEAYPREGGALVTADPGLVRGEVELLVGKLRETLKGLPPKTLEPGPLDRLGLLRMLRTECLRAWAEDDGSVLASMHAFEGVQEALLDWRREVTLSEVLTPFSRKLLREVAHMMRSPLGSIAMLADNLREGHSGPLTEAQEHQLGIIHRAALGMAATAGDVLTLVSDGDRIERTTAFSVADTLRTVADVVRPVTEARGRTLIVRSEDDVERTGPAPALREVLVGLALRAALAARGGEVELTATAESDDVLHIVVSTRPDPSQRPEDDPPDLLEIFRVDAETGSFTLSAQGLGVAAAHEVLDLIGSKLDVQTGADGDYRMTFRMRLPPD